MTTSTSPHGIHDHIAGNVTLHTFTDAEMTQIERALRVAHEALSYAGDQLRQSHSETAADLYREAAGMRQFLLKIQASR